MIKSNPSFISQFLQSKGFIVTWNLFITIFTILLALFIPLELGTRLWDLETYAFDTYAVTLLFTLDILIHLYQLKLRKKLKKEEPVDNLELYGKNWLLLDLLAAIPFGLIHPAFWTLRLFKLVKVFQKLRIIRLRVLQYSNQLLLLNLILFLVLIAHWISCGWLGIHGFERSESLSTNYVNAIYWSITTITTVGYGDIIPVSNPEKLYAILTMLTGLAFYGLLIGNIASILSKSDPAKEHFLENIEKLSTLVKYRSLTPKLQKRIYGYYTYKWKKRLGFDEVQFLEDLPMGLKMEVALHLKKEVIESISLFKDSPKGFIEDIALHLQPRVLTPGDCVFKAGDEGEEMYFIIQGTVKVVSKDSKVISTLSAGDFFGEIALFKRKKRTASIIAETYCDLYVLSKNSCDAVICQYPGIIEKIEKKAAARDKETQNL